MPVVRKYTKAGANVTPGGTITWPSGTGGVCWLHGRTFLGLWDDGIDLIEMDPFAGAAYATKSIDTFVGSSIQARNAAALHCGWQGIGEDALEAGWDNDHHTVAVLMKEVTGSPSATHAYIRHYEVGSWALVASWDLGIVIDMAGIAFAGSQYYWTGSYSVGPTTYHALFKLDLSAAGAYTVRLWNQSALWEGLAYDGHYLWAIESGSVIQVEQQARSIPRIVQSWPLTGVTNAQGITTDGLHLYVTSRF